MRLKQMWKRCVSILLVLCMVVTYLLPCNIVRAEDVGAVLWVDPVNGIDTNNGTTEATALKTISAAKTKAAELSVSSNVVVYLKGGTYTEGTITFGEAESGKNGNTITYKSAAGETAIISGGTRLDGWTLHDAEKNIYVTDIPEGTELIRQFYVNGQPMPNAYTEKSPTDWTLMSSGGYMSPNVDSADSNEYLILDLGEEKQVSKVTLYSGTNANENGTAAGFPKDFTISTSVDGNDWAVQVTETDYAAPAINVGVAFVFNTVQARYVKIDVTELGAPDRLNRAKYNLTLAEVVVGLAAQVGNVDLSVVEHLDLTTNLLSTEDIVSFKVGYYSDRATMNTFVEYIPTWASDPVTNLTDGKEGTYASTKGFQESWFLANGGQYTFAYVTELSEAVSIGAIKLTTGNTQGSLPTDFEVQISTDNNSWTTVVKEENFDWTAVGHQKIFAFNPNAVKYIRILGHKTTAFTDSNYYLRFTEMAIYKPSNVALGAEVEVSTEQKPDATWDKAYLVDGKFGGSYTSRATSSATTVDATITLGFSEAKEIAGIRLYPRYTSKGLVHYITSARFSVSTDGSTFETVLELSNIEPPASGAQLFVFPEAKEAKYIRIEPLCIEHGAETDYRFQLKEIEVAPAAETSSAVNFDAVITQGNATSDNSVSYIAKSITAKNDNAEIEFNALKAIDGIIIPVDDCGWYVPESYNFKEIGNLTDIEVHVLNNWYHNILRIDGVSNNGTEVSAETMGLRPTWLANAYEFIDYVGEWYIDRTAGRIYYKAADTMEGVEAVLPNVEQVIDMKDASNIVFDGITFEHTSYTLPSKIGYEDAQANTQVNNGWVQVNGGIMLDSCQNVTITNSVIRNMGTAGIKVRSNASVSDNVQITNNRIYDISFSGIIVGEVYGHHGYKSAQLVTNTVIRNNYITRVGIDLFDSPGIVATYTNGTIIDHNEVSYCPYTGISTGWGWDDEVDKDTGNALEEVGNLQITNNFVHDVMKTNRDGGAIYNLGTSKDSVISGNYLYNSWDGDDNLERMIYLDEGSSWIEVYDNVIGAEGGDWMNMWISSIKENHWHDNYYDAGLSQRNDGTNNIIENNTAVENGNFEAYPKAMEIINNAGLQTPALKEGIDKGFASEHDIVQEKYPGITSRYIETVRGWRNVAIEGQSSNTVYDSVLKLITIFMPAETDLTALALTYDLEEGFTCNVPSGTVVDFTNPVNYTLTNGDTTVIWVVNVKTEFVAGGDIVGTDVTLDDAIENYDSANWTKAPSASAEDSLTFNTYSGYIGERFGTDAILHFDMTSSLNDGSKDWLQISLRNQDPYTMCINGNTEYNIGFNHGDIEVQKFVNGERTVLYGIIEGFESVFGDIPNNHYTPDERHSITVGAINEDEGVRLFLFVDGNLVFDIIDADDPITDDGFFAVYGMTHAITLSKFTDIQNVANTTDSYVASLDCPDTSLNVGEQLTVNVSVAGVGYTDFASSEVVLTYDSTKLSFNKADSNLNGATVPDQVGGTIRLEDYGEPQSFGNAYTLVFDVISDGNATVTMTSAKFSTQDDAEYADLVVATLSNASVEVALTQMYSVTLPDPFTGNSSVQKGEDYTFAAKDANNYTYEVTATMNGQNVSVTDNGDGTYTVANVTGVLVISVTATPNSYSVTFAGTGVNDVSNKVTTATYGTAYTFTMPSATGYAYGVTITYTGTENAVEYSTDEAGVVTIAGDKITGNITITIDKTQTDANMSVEGSGASDVTLPERATPGTDFIFTVTQNDRYDYVVTVTVNDTEITPTEGDNGRYTIAGSAFDKGDTIKISVNKTVKTDNVTVSQYVTVDESQMWLITINTTKMDGSVYTYNGENMFWSEKYNEGNGAYCYLVVAAEQPVVSASDLAIVTGSATAVDYGMDVNMTGTVDANDAQLTYNMYKPYYSDFTDTVTMEKFLRADVNGDGEIDVKDAQVIVNHLLG